MNSTPEGERCRIVFFGRRNAGKSSLINAICGQGVSIVSNVPGTTTDPVRKAMEILPLGPALLVDTAGFDDDSAVGKERVKRTEAEMYAADFAVLVVDAIAGPYDESTVKIADRLRRAGVPFFAALNKTDAVVSPSAVMAETARVLGVSVHGVSCLNGTGIEEFKKALSELKFPEASEAGVLGGRLSAGDTAVLVVPIDDAAPKGRLILPQQQVIRDILQAGATAVVTSLETLADVLNSLKTPPNLVITDSRVFAETRAVVPKSTELTSFSILFAKYKGDYNTQKAGADAIDSLKDGDRVLIAEGCTHRRQCGDIGTQKIPMWLAEKTGKKLKLEFSSGSAWPEDLSGYSLIIHCGACMLSKREVRRRIDSAIKAGIPISNYGMVIAKLRGVEI